MSEEKFLTRSEAAEYISKIHNFPLSYATLSTYAWKGSGPDYVKLGKKIMYKIIDLDEWVKSKIKKFPNFSQKKLENEE